MLEEPDLARRVELLIPKDCTVRWQSELRSMNLNKPGARFRYPDGLMELAALLREKLRLTYRQLRGVLIAITKGMGEEKRPDLSTLCRRLEQKSSDPSTVDVVELPNGSLRILVRPDDGSIREQAFLRLVLYSRSKKGTVLMKGPEFTKVPTDAYLYSKGHNYCY